MGKEFDKVFEILKADKLDESSRAEVTKFITDVVELKAKERASELSESVIAEEKERLAEEYEAKFGDYKEDVFGKWSEFTDAVIAEEVQIPDNVKEFAALGETYKPLLEAIRTQLAVSEGSVDAEAKELLFEAKDEIQSLRSEINKLMSENIELKDDAKSMAIHIYLRKKCDGLTEAQRAKVMTLLEDVTDVKQINEKFDFIVENMLSEKKKKKEEEDDDDKEEDDDDKEDDDKEDKKKGKKDKKKDKDGKGNLEVDKDKLSESSSWDKLMEQYRNTLKVLP